MSSVEQYTIDCEHLASNIISPSSKFLGISPHDHWLAEPDSPNSDHSLEYWLGWSDIYVFEHVQLFDSWEDLLHKLSSVDLGAVSHAMSQFNQQQRNDLLRKWGSILEVAMSKHAQGPRRQRKPRRPRNLRPGKHRTAADLLERPLQVPIFDDAMRDQWGVDPLPLDRPGAMNDRCRELEHAPVELPKIEWGAVRAPGQAE